MGAPPPPEEPLEPELDEEAAPLDDELELLLLDDELLELELEEDDDEDELLELEELEDEELLELDEPLS